MRRQGLFWGSVILLLGVLLLLQTLGIVHFNVWPIFWALVLIFLGVWFLVRSRMRTGDFASENLSIARGGAVQAEVEIQHGAGKLSLRAASPGGALVEGAFGGGVVHTVQPSAKTRVKLDAGAGTKAVLPWDWPGGLRWDVRLCPDLPLDLIFRTGAGESDIDLTELDVKSVRLETGASSSRLILPARAQFTRVDVRAGLASVNMIVPQGVAAKIQTQTGLSGINIDAARFPPTSGYYMSADYDTAPNRIEIYVEGGMGSVEVH